MPNVENQNTIRQAHSRPGESPGTSGEEVPHQECACPYTFKLLNMEMRKTSPSSSLQSYLELSNLEDAKETLIHLFFEWVQKGDFIYLSDEERTKKVEEFKILYNFIETLSKNNR